MSDKQRIDILLVEKGLVETRQKAQSVIMAGLVYIDQQKIDKAGMKVKCSAPIEIRGNVLPYVSRGGLKLEKALQQFALALEGKTCMDVGASTGGFTDCMLQNGAHKVYAIDVGYGQLAWKLRQDDRVVNMERTNIRHVQQSDISENVDFVSIDVAFISLRLVLPVVKQLLKPGGELVCLIKPQFEAGREKVGKKGVVRDSAVHLEVVKEIVDFAIGIDMTVVDISYSPIKGPEGNIEYLLYVHNQKDENSTKIDEASIKSLVESSHVHLK